MKEIVIDCIEVKETDGGGMRENHVAYCSTQSVADELVKRGKGWRSSHPFKKVFTIADSVEDFDNSTKEALQKSALAKLSEAEKRALGF